MGCRLAVLAALALAPAIARGEDVPRELVERPLVLPRGVIEAQAGATWRSSPGEADALAAVRVGVPRAELFVRARHGQGVGGVTGGVRGSVTRGLALRAEAEWIEPGGDALTGYAGALAAEGKARLSNQLALGAAGGVALARTTFATVFGDGETTRMDLRLEGRAELRVSALVGLELATRIAIPTFDAVRVPDGALEIDESRAATMSLHARLVWSVTARVDAIAEAGLLDGGDAPKQLAAGLAGRF